MDKDSDRKPTSRDVRTKHWNREHTAYVCADKVRILLSAKTPVDTPE